MIKKHFWKMPLLLAVCGLAFALTGCGGTSNPRDAVNGGNGTTTPPWTPSVGLWDMADPDYPVLVETVPANNVADAVAHVNNNSGSFILAISGNVSSGPNALTAEDADLTVVGLGSDAVIRLTETGRLFSVGHATSGLTSNARLTLKNITLEGREQAYDLVRVWNGGRLYMDTGTTITGHTNTSPGTSGGLGAAVNVGADGTFTMRGGTITGNSAAHANGHTYLSGGVFVNNATSRFYMKGGSITGNTREMGNLPGAADIFVLNNVIYFTLSGDAQIHTLILNSYSTTNASITIGSGGWSGSVSNLYLRAGNTLTATFAGWLNRRVLQAASNQIITNADVERIAAKRFMVGSTATPPPLVSDTHEIVIEDGVGVLRANP